MRRSRGYVAASRGMIYSFFAQSLSAPREALALALCDGSLQAILQEAIAGAPAPHRIYDWRMTRMLKFSNGPAECLEALQVDYTRLFGIAVVCPHYEADYVSRDPFRMVHLLSDLTRFYTTFGVEVSKNAAERPDYIAIELEFMNFLASKQAHAIGRGETPRARFCREMQAKFFNEHLGLWAEDFGQ